MSMVERWAKEYAQGGNTVESRLMEIAWAAGFRVAREFAAEMAQYEVRPRMYEMGSGRLAEKIRKMGEE